MSLDEDTRAILEYRKKYGPGPFSTVDAFVYNADFGRVLMIMRSKPPGKGLWAMPGGFINPGEWAYDATIREVLEETNLFPNTFDARFGFAKAYVGNFANTDPTRDPRAHIITHVHMFVVRGQLMKIEAADDAADARWMRVGDITDDITFAGHASMVRECLNKI